ncbi:MAG: ABC transporter ATP-binding protein [Rhodopirellula sp.]|nr:ABC transporter ATP-binding protein [Rhodopirellula sp.]
MSTLAIRSLDKTYPGGAKALDGFDLDVADGELVAVVGPSGSGKTTLLRLIAGLDRPTGGSILLDGRSLAGVSPRERNVAMVFQRHALYPHLSVFGNIAFPLKLRGVARGEIARRVRQTAELLGIERLLDRRPPQLSGGEQQRVALGRAIVRQAACFLLDEPLSSLDGPLRDEMRQELRAMHRRLGTTTIYVTHDQQEALTLGRRIVVLRGGRIQQVGSPRDVYHHPASGFVAGFIGSPAMNFLRGKIVETGGRLWFEHAAGRIAIPRWAEAEVRTRTGTAATLGVRPEAIRESPAEGMMSGELRATVESVEFTGTHASAFLNLGGTRIVARLPADRQPAPAAVFRFGIDLDRVHFFETGSLGDEPGRNMCLALEPD